MRRFRAVDHPYIRQVMHRAAQDSAFRERLKRNARAAIKEETGIDVPADFDIQFLDRPDGDGVMMSNSPPPLPPEEEEEDEELSLEDLEEAAGGGGGDPPPEDPESPW